MAVQAAKDAREAANHAKDIASAADAAGKAAENAQAAINAIRVAGGHAKQAGDAAAEAGRYASEAGADASRANKAAAAARAQSARADRAANAAYAFAGEAKQAAYDSRDAANRAADDARAAAAAADAAVAHAGNAADAAKEATEHANVASAAAERANTAASTAVALFEAARKADAERLAVQSQQVEEAARDAADAGAKLEASKNWAATQEAQRDAETQRLLAEASAPNADPALVIADGRKIALRLTGTGGSWNRAAAAAALSGADAEVINYVRTGIARATGQDDRETLTSLAKTGSDKMRAAADAALAGSDEDVARFLRNPDYPARDTESRLTVNQILAAAKTAGNTTVVQAAQKALDTNNGDAYREFLDKGQYNALGTDDRLHVNQLAAADTSGLELKAMANATLAGPPGLIREFLASGQHVAARHDQEAAAHLATVAGFLSEAIRAATEAAQNAAIAQKVAAIARNAAKEADAWGKAAEKYAGEASGYAKEAHRHALEAEQSARNAAESAATAGRAAESAKASAQRASRSAVWAQVSAQEAAGYARAANDAAREAYDNLIAAGKKVDEAVAAANEAINVYNQKIKSVRADIAQRLAGECKYLEHVNPEEYKNCIYTSGYTALHPGEVALERSKLCNLLFSGSENYRQNCLHEVLSPHFEAMQALTLATPLIEAGVAFAKGLLFLEIGVVGGALCAEACTVLFAATPWGIELAPLVTSDIAAGLFSGIGGAAGGIGGLRLRALLEEDAAGASAAGSRIARLQQQLARWPVPPCLWKGAGYAGFAVPACGLIPYNSDELGKLAFIARERAGYGPGRNVAVARVPGWKSENPNVPDDFVVGFSSADGQQVHSEGHILEQLQAKGFTARDIKAIYTERSPCDDCEKLLKDLEQGTPITWSVPYSKEWYDATTDLLKRMIQDARRG
ncbi:nucleic acid/nucleotide deaminase domain-containing protein [Amycolatopsis sp. NPDC059027]|uniref:nucleic acid/nucleotide deaminase domain-containing protein n=1 Tax=Amycolatopsis sp. NPDC059027 TaxID=3346709 RepID=UPI00366A69A5